MHLLSGIPIPSQKKNLPTQQSQNNLNNADDKLIKSIDLVFIKNNLNFLPHKKSNI